jgi:hypothetical protein
MEPTDGIALLAVAHVASAMFMAAPLYMLVIVNERARLGAPLGLPHDAYLENIIRRQPIRCYAYLGVLILTGVAIVVARGESFTSPMLLVKIAATAALLAILSYVHFSLQPRVDRELATLAPGAACSGVCGSHGAEAPAGTETPRSDVPLSRAYGRGLRRAPADGVQPRSDSRCRPCVRCAQLAGLPVRRALRLRLIGQK